MGNVLQFSFADMCNAVTCYWLLQIVTGEDGSLLQI